MATFQEEMTVGIAMAVIAGAAAAADTTIHGAIVEMVAETGEETWAATHGILPGLDREVFLTRDSAIWE